MNTQTKTGEWTAESVMRLFGWKYKKRAEQVSAVHNAAIAKEIDRLRSQLAAEKVQALTSDWKAQQCQVFNDKGIIGNANNESEAKAISNSHNAAIVAEKSREDFDWGHVKREYLRLQKENSKLEEQLAAEMEKVQTLVDAMKLIAGQAAMVKVGK